MVDFVGLDCSCIPLDFGLPGRCAAVAGEGIVVGLFNPFVSVAVVFGVLGLGIWLECTLSLPMISKPKSFTLRLSLLILYFKYNNCCKLVLSLKNAGGFVEAWIILSNVMDATRTNTKHTTTTIGYFLIGTPHQRYKKLCRKLPDWPVCLTVVLDCEVLLRISGVDSCISNVPLGSLYMAKSQSLELGEGD